MKGEYTQTVHTGKKIPGGKKTFVVCKNVDIDTYSEMQEAKRDNGGGSDFAKECSRKLSVDVCFNSVKK